jgi:hypothetical protein
MAPLGVSTPALLHLAHPAAGHRASDEVISGRLTSDARAVDADDMPTTSTFVGLQLVHQLQIVCGV